MILNGLVFGLISTLHCAGMCGPLAMYLPTQVKNRKWIFVLCYHSGRIGIYISIGVLVFLLGLSFSVFKLQQVLSIVIGSLLILGGLLPLFKWPQPIIVKTGWNTIQQLISTKIASDRSSSAFLLGVMNGLLPCGAIYVAALFCSTFVEINDAILYMGLFGLGTLPVFIAAWLMMSKKLALNVRKFSVLYRFLPILVGILMILRGANLGIPYLSPELNMVDRQPVVENCCEKK